MLISKQKLNKELLDIRYVRNNPKTIEKIEFLKDFLNIEEYTNLIDFLITDKFQQIKKGKVKKGDP